MIETITNLQIPKAAIFATLGAAIGSATTIFIFLLKEIVERNRRKTTALKLLEYYCNTLNTLISSKPSEHDIINPLRLEPYIDIYLSNKYREKTFTTFHSNFIKWKRGETQNLTPIQIKDIQNQIVNKSSLSIKISKFFNKFKK